MSWRPHRLRAALVLCFAAAAACGGPAHRPIVGALDAPVYPTQVRAGGLVLLGVLVEDHARVLGRDLAREEGLLPVAVRIDRGGAEVEPDALALALRPLLVLEDGTELAPVEAGDLELSERAAAAVMDPHVALAGWPSGEARLFLFDADAARVRLRGLRGLVLGAHHHREVQLQGSVLALQVPTPDGPRRVHMGLSVERWRAER